MVLSRPFREAVLNRSRPPFLVDRRRVRQDDDGQVNSGDFGPAVVPLPLTTCNASAALHVEGERLFPRQAGSGGARARPGCLDFCKYIYLWRERALRGGVQELQPPSGKHLVGLRRRFLVGLLPPASGRSAP